MPAPPLGCWLGPPRCGNAFDVRSTGTGALGQAAFLALNLGRLALRCHRLHRRFHGRVFLLDA